MPTSRRLLVVFLSALTFIAVLGFFAFRKFSDLLLQPVQVFGSPLRVADRTYLFTGQWRTRFSYTSNRYTSGTSRQETDLLVDLWAFDANTASPLWRKRLQTERNGAMMGRALLGAEGNTLWLLAPKGLMAASLQTGDILAEPSTIEQRNPNLRGLLPREHTYYRFDTNGLMFLAADGTNWRLDPQTFTARPAAGPPPSHTIVPPAYYAPNSTESFQQRDLPIPGRWLGVLNDQEMVQLRDTRSIGGLDSHSRRKLWAARTGTGKNFFGEFKTYFDFTPLGNHDYLAPGLLSDHKIPGPQQALFLRDPDSVLILHHDRLGEEGRLQLDRVAGPEGRTIWKTALPLSVLQSVLPGEKSIVLYGVQFNPPKDGRPRDPFHDARNMLVSIDLATGQLHVHDQSDVDRHPEATQSANRTGS